MIIRSSLLFLSLICGFPAYSFSDDTQNKMQLPSPFPLPPKEDFALPSSQKKDLDLDALPLLPDTLPTPELPRDKQPKTVPSAKDSGAVYKDYGRVLMNPKTLDLPKGNPDKQDSKIIHPSVAPPVVVMPDNKILDSQEIYMQESENAEEEELSKRSFDPPVHPRNQILLPLEKPVLSSPGIKADEEKRLENKTNNGASSASNTQNKLPVAVGSTQKDSQLPQLSSDKLPVAVGSAQKDSKSSNGKKRASDTSSELKGGKVSNKKLPNGIKNVLTTDIIDESLQAETQKDTDIKPDIRKDHLTDFETQIHAYSAPSRLQKNNIADQPIGLKMEHAQKDKEKKDKKEESHSKEKKGDIKNSARPRTYVSDWSASQNSKNAQNDAESYEPSPTIYKPVYENYNNDSIPKIRYQSDYDRLIFEIIKDCDIGALSTIIGMVQNLEVKNHEGDNPLIYSVKLGKINCIRLLLGRGANPDSKDRYGNSAGALAGKIGRLDILRLLNQYKHP